MSGRAGVFGLLYAVSFWGGRAGCLAKIEGSSQTQEKGSSQFLRIGTRFFERSPASCLRRGYLKNLAYSENTIQYKDIIGCKLSGVYTARRQVLCISHAYSFYDITLEVIGRMQCQNSMM